jgi:hypothetical protein
VALIERLAKKSYTDPKHMEGLVFGIKYCLDAFSAQAGGPQFIGLKQYERLCEIIGHCLKFP